MGLTGNRGWGSGQRRVNDSPTFGRRLEAHLRAGFGAPTAEGPSRFHGAGLQAPGGRRGSEGVARPRCTQLAWPCLCSGRTWQGRGPCRTGCQKAHRHRNDRKTQKLPTNRILNLFLICSWIKKPVGNQEGRIPLPQSMLSFRHPCHGQAMSEGPGHTPGQVKREQITLLVRKKEVSRAFSHPGGRRARPHGSMWREKKHTEEDSKIFLI